MKVDASQPPENFLLVVIDGELGGKGVAVAAGLYLDEAESGAVPGNEIEISTDPG